MRYPLQRRSFLGLGMLAGAAWSTGASAASQTGTDAVPKQARAKNVLVILEQGGMSHIDTWDPKPEAVAEHRSPYKPVSTNVPGMHLTELFAKTACHADKLAIVRSMHHRQTGHGEGTQTMLQGWEPGGPVAMPDLGSAITHMVGSPCDYLPAYLMIPGNHEQAGVTNPGFLPKEYEAYKTGGRDLSDPRWKMRDFALLDGVDARRLNDRRDLLSNLNVGVLPVGGTGSFAAVQRFQEQAFNVLSNPRTSAAFNLTAESEATRAAYGQGHRGQCYLLGRRMVEEGVRFVVVDVREPQTDKTPGGFNMNWDHHDLMYANGSCGTIRDKAGGEGRYGIGHWVMMGSTDQAFAALLEDMHQRGLLAETLVCFVTEFGRTPRLNSFQGRDHWSNAYSIAFAGAGIRGGQVIGATDRDGGFIKDRPHTPLDYAATIYELLGIDRTRPIYTRDQRPVFLTAEGRPIEGLV